MKKTFFGIFFFCTLFQSFAHDVSKVNFKIETLSDQIKVTVDLPWTLKDALETYDPSLKEDKSRENFNRVLKNYVATHFILWSTANEKIPLKSVTTAPVGDKHVHGAYFNFFFELDDIGRIENTFLFETNQSQHNKNQIKLNDTWFCFETTTAKKNIQLCSSKNLNTRSIVLAIVFIVFTSSAIYFRFFNLGNRS